MPGQIKENFSVGGNQYVSRDLYTYQVSFTAANLTSGATLNGSINIDADSDFVWQKAIYFADDAAADQTDSSRIIPLVTAIITDTGSGRQLMQAGVPVPSIFGTGQLPFVLPIPRLFFASSTISVQVANFNAATAYDLYLSFVGFKAYRQGQ